MVSAILCLPIERTIAVMPNCLRRWVSRATLSLNSVGSLDEDLLREPWSRARTTLVSPPSPSSTMLLSAFAPSIDNRLLDSLEPSLSCQIAKDRIYAQTRGPRFETKAEVRILQKWGCDVVGMTFANECDLLLESGISVTSLCMIDNFAHGIGIRSLATICFEIWWTKTRKLSMRFSRLRSSYSRLEKEFTNNEGQTGARIVNSLGKRPMGNLV